MSSESQCSLATVESVESGGLALVFDGEDTARTKTYKCLGSYIPTAGDRVCVMAISGTYIVMGEVSNAPASAVAQSTRANQVVNQYNTSSAYDIKLRATSATTFQIGRVGGSWLTISTT